MFEPNQAYTGTAANKIVKKMVAEYESTISNLVAQVSKAGKKIVDLQREKKALTAENFYLHSKIEELSAELASKKKSKESPWILQQKILSYDSSDSVEIRFDLCTLPNQDQYIDARKYQNGNPTRKGICLSVDNFHQFLTYARIAWARVDSGIFKIREEKKHESKQHTCKNCKGRI